MYSFFVFSYNQDNFTLLTPVSTLLIWGWIFLRSGANLYLKKTQVLVIVSLAYYLLFAVINHPLYFVDIEETVSHIAKDARIIYMMAFLLLFSFLSHSVAVDRKLLRAALWINAIIALLSLLSLLGLIQVPNEFSLKLFTTGLLGKNSYSGAIGSCLVLFAYLAVYHPRFAEEILDLRIYWVLLAVIFVAFVFSGSRGYFAAGVLTIFIFVVLRPSRPRGRRQWNTRFFLFAISVVGMLVFFFTYQEKMVLVMRGDDPSLYRRVNLYKDTGHLIARSPLFGLGPGTSREGDLMTREIIPHLFSVRESGVAGKRTFYLDYVFGQHAHNFILLMLVDYGLIGLALFAGILYAVFKKGRRLKNGSRSLAIYSGCWWYLFLYLFFAGILASYPMITPPSAWIWYYLTARIIAYNRGDREPAAIPGTVPSGRLPAGRRPAGMIDAAPSG